eukprot:3802729-Rhodomonas_salina.1
MSHAFARRRIPPAPCAFAVRPCRGAAESNAGRRIPGSPCTESHLNLAPERLPDNNILLFGHWFRKRDKQGPPELEDLRAFVSCTCWPQVKQRMAEQ